MTTRRQPRSLQRAGFTDVQRLSMLEQDADECEDAQADLVGRFDTEMGSVRKVLIAFAFTVAASALGAMITLVVTHR